MKIKIRACKLGSENTSWRRKYHKDDEMDKKINCEIFSIECKNHRWKYIKYYVRDNKVRGTSGIAKKILVVKNTTRSEEIIHNLVPEMF